MLGDREIFVSTRLPLRSSSVATWVVWCGLSK